MTSRFPPFIPEEVPKNICHSDMPCQYQDGKECKYEDKCLAKEVNK